MKKFCLLLICLFFLVGCKAKTKEEQLKEIIEKNNYIIVDVRTKEEYEEQHVENAINIPYDEIDSNVDLDKSKTILVYCKSGKRSNIAYNTLKKLQYDVFDLGGFDNLVLN